MQSQRGQIALISLLLMVVVLTIGISIATRTTMDVSITRQEEVGSRTFQAAESGVEEALTVGEFTDTLQNDTFDSSFPDLEAGTYSIRPVGASGSYYFESSSPLLEGSSIQVPVEASTGTLTISWHKGASCTNSAALLVRVYSLNGTAATVRSFYYGCDATTHPGSTAGVAGSNGYYRRIVLTRGSAATDALEPNTTYLVSVQPTFADTSLKIEGDALSGPMQWQVSSSAKNLGGNETKAVEVMRSIPMNPSIFDYVLYSGNTLVKFD